MNKIHFLQKKTSEFHNELKNLDLNDKLNPGSFYKKQTKQAEVKAAVVDKNGNLVINKQLIINEYRKKIKGLGDK